MGKLILVTGGCRSGKSSFALQKASEYAAFDLSCPKGYIATAPPLDQEMQERIKRHRLERAEQNFITIEEQCDLEQAIITLSLTKCRVVVIDCLTLWINNLIYHRNIKQVPPLTQDEMTALSAQLAAQILAHDLTAVAVINEVGLGVMPENQLARNFADLSGRCAQTLAKYADEVFFLCCGLPLKIK